VSASPSLSRAFLLPPASKMPTRTPEAVSPPRARERINPRPYINRLFIDRIFLNHHARPSYHDWSTNDDGFLNYWPFDQNSLFNDTWSYPHARCDMSCFLHGTQEGQQHSLAWQLQPKLQLQHPPLLSYASNVPFWRRPPTPKRDTSRFAP
jgi:hypothetical protein